MSEERLLVNVKEVQRLLGGISKSAIAVLIKKKKLLPLRHIHKRNQLYKLTDILALIDNKL